MPTYQYACTACGHRFEAVQSFSDSSLTDCPECAGRLRKVFSSVGIVFKGSGFYRTDSRSGGGDKAAGGESGPGKDVPGKDAGSSGGSKESSSTKDGGSSGGGTESAKPDGGGGAKGPGQKSAPAKSPAAAGSAS